MTLQSQCRNSCQDPEYCHLLCKRKSLLNDFKFEKLILNCTKFDSCLIILLLLLQISILEGNLLATYEMEIKVFYMIRSNA